MMHSVPVWCLILLATVSGCGGPAKAKITGTLTNAGKPLQVSDKTLVTLSFTPDGDNVKQSYPAKFKHADGTFQVEVPVGKYRASLVMVDYEKKSPPQIPAGVKNTVYDLTHDKVLDIDISK